jgi:hypothetical protein
MNQVETDAKWDLEGYEDIADWIVEIKKLPRLPALLRVVVRIKACNAIIAGLCLEPGAADEGEAEVAADPVVTSRTPVTRSSTKETPVLRTIENDPKVRGLTLTLISLLTEL